MKFDLCITAFRCDATFDQTQKDHEYTVLNVIKKDTERDLKFIGIGHVTERDAASQALKSGTSWV